MVTRVTALRAGATVVVATVTTVAAMLGSMVGAAMEAKASALAMMVPEEKAASGHFLSRNHPPLLQSQKLRSQVAAVREAVQRVATREAGMMAEEMKEARVAAGMAAATMMVEAASGRQ